ncbi:hypothetical protein CLH39_14595 [Alcaligenes faecalis]|uniref:DUF1176 domain-containing protein n=1 Tax=Alcaligenes faecalis TaxID=511 RepID=UPI0019341317|nr:DUF1176 domain-containing protein [Alcaligenes faecalis]QRF91370.1 hypothetical protein CLH39_14595 [Alcaligenes faecalis]
MSGQKQDHSAFFSVRTAAISLVLCMGGAAANAASVTFSHKDWDLRCDNTLTCRAAGYAADGEELGSTVLLTRKAGSGEPVANRVMLAHYDDPEWPKDSLPELVIAGRKAGSLSVAGMSLGK